MSNKLKYLVPTLLVAFGLLAITYAQTTHTNVFGQVFSVYKLSDGMGASATATANRLYKLDGNVEVEVDAKVNRNLAVTGTSTLTGNAALAGNLAVTGNSTLTGQLISVPQASTVTNGAVLTLSGVVNNVTASEAATVTLVNPGAAGRIVVVANVGTNNLTVAQATNLALGAATRVVTPHGTITLVSTTATAWKEVAIALGNAIE